MKTLMKPKHCGQNWLDMKPTEGGRICGQCEKKIVDFTKKSWKDISKIQEENNNSLCGMYAPKQLEYWGQEIPSNKTVLIKAAAITGFCVSIAGSAFSQNPTEVGGDFFVKGTVMDKNTKERMPIGNVLLKQNKKQATIDLEGNFEFEIKNASNLTFPDTMQIEYLGFKPYEIIFKDVNELRNMDKNIFMTLEDSFPSVTIFSVAKPPLGDRIKWKLRKMFKRKRN